MEERITAVQALDCSLYALHKVTEQLMEADPSEPDFEDIMKKAETVKELSVATVGTVSTAVKMVEVVTKASDGMKDASRMLGVGDEYYHD